MDWAETYFDAGHTGANAKETLLSPSNVPNLQLRWARSLGSDTLNFVVNDHRVIARASSDDGADIGLWYMDYSTGETYWHIDTGPNVPGASGTLAIGDRHVLAECGLIDQVQYPYSGICAYRKNNGRLRWRLSNPCNCSPEANVAAPLAYDHHVVLFGYFNGGGDGKDYVVAASSVSGQIYGSYQVGAANALGGAAISRGPAKIYFGCGANVCALHSGGTLAWQANIGAPAGGITAPSNHKVYATVCNGPAGLVALDDASGAVVWSYGTPQCNQQPVAASDNKVFLASADGDVHALDAQSGTELWSAAAGAASSPSVANGVVYVAGASGAPVASAYDAATGALLWSAPARSAGRPLPPIVIDGNLYVANADCGSICAYGLPTASARPHR